jgi:hypothetical protein
VLPGLLPLRVPSSARGPFAGPRPASNLSLRVLGSPSGSCRVVCQAHVSRLSPRASPPYPPGYVFPVPFGGRHLLLGPSWARCGFGPSFRRSSGLPAGSRRTATGLPRFAPGRCAGGGCLLYPGAAVSWGHPNRGGCLHAGRTGPAFVARFRLSHHRCDGLFVTGPRSKVTWVHPSQLPLACGPTVVSGLLGFSPLLSHASLPNACGGWGLAWTLARAVGNEPRPLLLERLRVANDFQIRNIGS